MTEQLLPSLFPDCTTKVIFYGMIVHAISNFVFLSCIMLNKLNFDFINRNNPSVDELSMNRNLNIVVLI